MLVLGLREMKEKGETKVEVAVVYSDAAGNLLVVLLIKWNDVKNARCGSHLVMCVLKEARRESSKYSLTPHNCRIILIC